MGKIKEFSQVNKNRSRNKVFEQFEDFYKPFPSIDEKMISYGCVLRNIVNQ